MKKRKDTKKEAVKSPRNSVECKKEREKLRESEEKFRILTENVPIGIYYNDLNGIFLYGNKRAEEIVGCKKKELIGKTFLKLKLLNPKDILRAAKLLTLNRRGKPTGPDEFTLNRKDGSKRLVEIKTNVITIAGGKVVLGMVQDVTERKEAERALREREEQCKIIFDQSADPIAIVDKKGNFLEVNAGITALTGFTKEDLIGKNFLKIPIITLKDKIILLKNLRLRMTGKELPLYEIEGLTKEGEKIPLEVNAKKIIYEGKLADLVTFRDITERKKIERAKTEFVSLISHQLRSPLSSIKWCAEIILREGNDEMTPRQKRYLKEIYHSNERMINLTKALLNASRIEMGLLAIETKPTDIRNLLEEVVMDQETLIKEKKQQIIINQPKKLSKIPIDPQLIRIVFQNLLSNAVKYTKTGGKIICTMKIKDHELLVKFKDNGIGIPKKQQNRVFEKLFRGDNALNLNPEGIGLGLYIAKAVIEASGGKIWFKSKEGGGTTFWFTLPLKG